jgi:hypothetical protein
MSDLKYRGEAMIDILRITVREELRQEYKLDLGEMYLLMDYVAELRYRIQRLERLASQAENLLAHLSSNTIPDDTKHSAKLLREAIRDCKLT